MTGDLSTVLEVRDICVTFGGSRAVDGVSMAVPEGAIVGLIGPNGAGKTTLLKVMAGLVRPDQGSVSLRGVDVTRSGIARRARAGLAMTFQVPRSVANLTVGEQLLIPLASFRRFGSRERREHWQALVQRVVADLDLAALLDRYPTELTLGEIRRFEVARALMREPAILLVDEPASGMSSEDVVTLAGQLRRVAAGGVAVLLIEHNVPFVREVASTLHVLDLGRLIASGSPADVLANDAVKDAYLGVSGA
ncbi:MAG: ATP-binding cassette domain-containing protein [Acidimicrobiales bacterium]